MASSVDRNRMFSARILSTPEIFKETFKLFGPQGCSDDKNWVVFSSIWFSLTFVGFAVQFCFRCKFSFHETPFESSLTVAWFFLTNHNSLVYRATNEIVSFCIDNRLRQMAFFVFAKVGKGRRSSNWERFWNKRLKLCVFLLYKTNRFHVAVRLFSNRSPRTSKCGKNISDTLGYRLVCHFFVLTTFWRHLWSITEQSHSNMESIC